MSRRESTAMERPPAQDACSDWGAPTTMPVLPRGEAHVWVASLERPRREMDGLWETLNDDERDRANRCRSPRNRRRCVAARGMLRALLGHYLSRPAVSVALACTPRGKPHLAQDERLDAGGPAVHFNLSHSEETVLYAFARGRPVGVDIEMLRPSTAHSDIARRFFAPEEVLRLETAPPGAFTPAFLACWVRKEACLKAVGAGLALPMREVIVPTCRTPRTAFHIELSRTDRPRHWTGHDLPGRDEFVASLVFEGHGLRVRLWEWT